MCNLLIHGGVGSDESLSSLLNEYALKAVDVLSSLESVINATVLMENDARFNAGTGSYQRLDGSIQMDAAVMTETGFGSVMAVERIKNPILLAKDVMEKTPHLIMAGDGAVRFARVLGYPDYDPNTQKAEEQAAKVLADLNSKEPAVDTRYDKMKAVVDLKRFLKSTDTVGAVSYIGGKFAAAVSTGGASPMLRGRVGDSPVPGAGIFCGKKGAVVATGIGEEIISHMLSISVYDEIGNSTLKEILKKKTDGFKGPVGLIAVDSEGYAYHANKSMAVGLSNKLRS